VIWGGEFAARRCLKKRRPRSQSVGFRCGWPAGGVKGGQAIGRADEVGLYAVEDKMHVHDLQRHVPAI